MGKTFSEKKVKDFINWFRMTMESTATIASDKDLQLEQAYAKGASALCDIFLGKMSRGEFNE